MMNLEKLCNINKLILLMVSSTLIEKIFIILIPYKSKVVGNLHIVRCNNYSLETFYYKSFRYFLKFLIFTLVKNLFRFFKNIYATTKYPLEYIFFISIQSDQNIEKISINFVNCTCTILGDDIEKIYYSQKYKSLERALEIYSELELNSIVNVPRIINISRDKNIIIKYKKIQKNAIKPSINRYLKEIYKFEENLNNLIVDRKDIYSLSYMVLEYNMSNNLPSLIYRYLLDYNNSTHLYIQHGDMWKENILFDINNVCYFIDFDNVILTRKSFDVFYFLCIEYIKNNSMKVIDLINKNNDFYDFLSKYFSEKDIELYIIDFILVKISYQRYAGSLSINEYKINLKILEYRLKEFYMYKSTANVY